jgi:hypothetical protein
MLSKHYGGSLVKCLRAIYPNHEWDELRFRFKPQRFWANAANRRRFLDHVMKELGMKTLSDWYKHTHADVKKLGGSMLE